MGANGIQVKDNLKRTEPQKPVYVQVVDHIQESIKRGDLTPGDQLLPERNLAENLGVSRTSVRQALAVLEGKGFLEITPRDGAYIRQRSIEGVVESLTDILFQERKHVGHLFEVRSIIETQAACLAAERCTKKDIERLQDLNRQFEADLQDDQGLAFDANMAFHIAIVETAKNPLLIEIMATILTATIEVYETARQQSLSDTPDTSKFVKEHEQIVNAIAQKNAKLAAQLTAKHISDSSKRVALFMAEETNS